MICSGNYQFWKFWENICGTIFLRNKKIIMIKKPNQSIIRKITRALSILANENQTEVKFVKNQWSGSYFSQTI